MISISLKDTEIPGPLQEIQVNYDAAKEGNELDEASVEEKAAILNGKFKELIESWKVLIVGKSEFQKAYFEG